MERDEQLDEAPAPRLCHLIKWADFDGYGFNLHAERSNPGQFVGKIDEQSPAELAGLREGDRIVEVNGVNISNENHRQVVERIKSLPGETKLLVVDAAADLWYRERELVVKSSQMNVIYRRTPVPRPPGAEGAAAPPPGNADGAPTVAAHVPPPPPPPPPPMPGALASPLAGAGPRSRPPMSPDSGKGDDDQEPASTPTNRAQPEEPPRAGTGGQVAANESPASDAKEQARLEHNGSADSGKSSSPDGASSNDGADSLVDSLENSSQPMSPDTTGNELVLDKQHQETNLSDMQTTRTTTMTPTTTNETATKLQVNGGTQLEVSATETSCKLTATSNETNAAAAGGLGTEAQSIRGNAPTIQDSTEAAAATANGPGEAANGSNNNNDIEQPQGQQKLEDLNTLTATKTTITTATVKSNGVDDGEPKQQLESDKRASTTSPGIMTTATASQGAPVPPNKQQQQASPKPQATTTSSNNNNYSGLNLNMTAGEMRELLARRKKFDPKKAQMNIRQKYEIIQQM